VGVVGVLRQQAVDRNGVAGLAPELEQDPRIGERVADAAELPVDHAGDSRR